MPQSKEVHKEYMRRRRQGSQEGSQTPAVVRALTDPKKRAMLEYISEDLKKKGLARELRYGVFGPDFEVISELLECTEEGK